MNVNSNGPNAPRPTDRYREAMDTFIQRTRTNLAHARHLASRLAEARQDGVENAGRPPAHSNAGGSPNSQLVRRDTVDISNNMEAPEVGNDQVLRPKLARLKHLYRTGQLFKPEMLERAAHNLLQRRENTGSTDMPNESSSPVQTVRKPTVMAFAPYTGGSDVPNTADVPNTGSDVPNL